MEMEQSRRNKTFMHRNIYHLPKKNVQVFAKQYYSISIGTGWYKKLNFGQNHVKMDRIDAIYYSHWCDLFLYVSTVTGTTHKTEPLDRSIVLKNFTTNNRFQDFIEKKRGNFLPFELMDTSTRPVSRRGDTMSSESFTPSPQGALRPGTAYRYLYFNTFA